MTIPVAKAPLLGGKRGLIVGIANDQSIVWGCAARGRNCGQPISTIEGSAMAEITKVSVGQVLDKLRKTDVSKSRITRLDEKIDTLVTKRHSA